MALGTLLCKFGAAEVTQRVRSRCTQEGMFCVYEVCPICS